MTRNKIDLTAPELTGKIFEFDESTGELKYPPKDEELGVVSEAEFRAETEADKLGCGGQVATLEDGNTQYAWWYLINRSSSQARVTVERRWVFGGRWQKDTVSYNLAPRSRRNVMNMQRGQNPSVRIVSCSL